MSRDDDKFGGVVAPIILIFLVVCGVASLAAGVSDGVWAGFFGFAAFVGVMWMFSRNSD